jgi:hypothetical protein
MRWAVLLVLAAVISVLTWAGMAPVQTPSREKVFEIPKGTWARRMAGENAEILPDEIRLTLNAQDILLLKNQDDVPQIFGPTLMMPGQSLRLPFAVASENQFACTAHASGQMTVIVEPYPANAWARIGWRARRMIESLRENQRSLRENQQEYG